jgi:hypothetical protein
MDRRNFIGTLVGGLAATAAVRTWPFRVYSFPSDIIYEKPGIRLVRHYDLNQDPMLTRFDAAFYLNPRQKSILLNEL